MSTQNLKIKANSVIDGSEIIYDLELSQYDLKMLIHTNGKYSVGQIENGTNYEVIIKNE